MSIRNRLILAVVLTAAHLAFSIICIGEADFLYADEATTRRWQIALRIISFPIVYLNLLSYRGPVPKLLDFDWIPALVVLNSLFWGFALTLVISLLAKRYCKTYKKEQRN